MNEHRRDAFPEFTIYRDTGCDLHPSCLSCPLPQCRFDTHKGSSHMAANARHDEVRNLLATGLTVMQVAERCHVSRRTVFRVKAEGVSK